MSSDQTAYGVVVAIKDIEWKFLILLQDKDVMNWSFPKGKTEEGETVPLDIAMRELGEETGITDIKILDVPSIQEVYEFTRKGESFNRVNKYFVGIVQDKNIKIQEGGILDYKWVSFEEALNTFQFKKESRIEVLKQAKEYLEQYDSRK